MVIQARRYHKHSYRPCRQAEYQFPRVKPRVIRRQWASELTARPKILFDRFATQKPRWKRIAGESSDSFSQRNISTEDTSIRLVYPFQSSGSIYLSPNVSRYVHSNLETILIKQPIALILHYTDLYFCLGGSPRSRKCIIYCAAHRIYSHEKISLSNRVYIYVSHSSCLIRLMNIDKIRASVNRISL